MNKQDLVEVLAEAAGTTKAAANRGLDAILEAISHSLSKGKPVTLVGFGSFVVSKRKARNGRNPQTGETIKIPAANVPKFRAGAQLKKKVNKGK